MNTFSYYKEFINKLQEIEHIQFTPLYEFEVIPSKITIGLRHDIDSNPRMAVRFSKHLARLGIPSTFYLLPSSSYYRDYSEHDFARNKNLVNILHQLIISGCEIGLHNDAFEFGKKAPERIKLEINWLRANGAKIRGTVAHNNLASYKAENYEIFKERILFKRKVLDHRAR